MKLFLLETERLLLRPMRLEDAKNMYLLNADPDILKYTGDAPFRNIKDAKEFIASYDQYSKYGVGRYTVIHKVTGEYLGWCGFRYNREDTNYDIGFRFRQQYWNQGYATEAARTCLDYGIHELQLKSIIGRCDHRNRASRRVLEKIGLKFLYSSIVDGQSLDIFSYQK